ncbi:MAG: DUF1173 domain-containing protein [Burkholderiaceae bacterium]|nr:DUF1173 domain-containing protein [Burkholderiaceae bacterium]
MRRSAIESDLYGDPVRAITIQGVRYEEHWLQDNYLAAQDVLRNAYDSAVSPLCMCKPEGVKLYVSKHNRYFLARLPESGPLHAMDCPSYESPPAMSGRRCYYGGSLEERDGCYIVMPAFPLDGWWPSTASRSPRGEANREARKIVGVGLEGLLHLTWEASRFATWFPRMAGKRNWGLVRHFVEAAARHIEIDGIELGGCIWVPEAFDRQKRREQLLFQQARIEQLVGGLKDTQRQFLVLGAVKSISSTQRDDRLLISHMPEAPFWMQREMRPLVTRAIGEFDPFAEGAETRLICLAQVEKDRHGGLQVRDAAFMIVDREWMPVRTRFEQRVAAQLREQGRSFTKPLRYECSPDMAVPNFLLLDVGSEPGYMEIFSGFGSSREQKNRLASLEQRQQLGAITWLWNITRCGAGVIPPIPARAVR